MIPPRALLPFALAFAISISPRVNAVPGFNDGDFTTYAWTAAKILDTTAGQSAVFSAGGVSTGGDAPGKAYRSNSFSFTYTGTPASQGIVIGNISSGMTYSPAVSGAISNIFSFDIASFYSPPDQPPGLSLSVGLLLLQNGNYYTNRLQDVESYWSTGKGSGSATFAAADFALVGSSGPLNPDFTTNGGTIEFGYATAASVSSGAAAPIAGSIGADDFIFAISNTPMPLFIRQQTANATNLSVTLTGLAFGESITWLVSPDMMTWSTNYPNPTSIAAGTNGTFTITNWVYPRAPIWFLQTLVQ